MHGAIPPDVLGQVRDELREIVRTLETGASVPQMPQILAPPEQPARRSAARRMEPKLDDDDIPF